MADYNKFKKSIAGAIAVLTAASYMPASVGAGEIFGDTFLKAYAEDEENPEENSDGNTDETPEEDETYVASIDKTNYPTLQAAVNDAKDNDTIDLQQDVYEQLTIGADKNITLNLNGHSITTEKTTIINNGNLKIKGEGTINSEQESAIVVNSGASLTIWWGNFISNKNFDVISISEDNDNPQIYITDGRFSDTSVREYLAEGKLLATSYYDNNYYVADDFENPSVDDARDIELYTGEEEAEFTVNFRSREPFSVKNCGEFLSEWNEESQMNVEFTGENLPFTISKGNIDENTAAVLRDDDWYHLEITYIISDVSTEPTTCDVSFTLNGEYARTINVRINAPEAEKAAAVFKPVNDVESITFFNVNNNPKKYTADTLEDFSDGLVIKAGTEVTVTLNHMSVFNYFDGKSKTADAEMKNNEDGTYTYTFTMPGYDVNIEKVVHSINVWGDADISVENDDYQVNEWEDNKRYYYPGSEITVNSEDMLSFDDVESVEGGRNEDGTYTYTFTMPNNEVNVYCAASYGIWNNTYNEETGDSAIVEGKTTNEDRYYPGTPITITANSRFVVNYWDEEGNHILCDSKGSNVGDDGKFTLTFEMPERDIDVNWYEIQQINVNLSDSYNTTYTYGDTVPVPELIYTIGEGEILSPEEATASLVLTKEGSDELFEFGTVLDAGTYTISLNKEDSTILNKEDYRWSYDEWIWIGNVEVFPFDLSEAEISFDGKSSFVYNKKYHSVGITVSANGMELEEDEDYFTDGTFRAKKSGEYAIKVYAPEDSNYCGEQEITWSINQASLTGNAPTTRVNPANSRLYVRASYTISVSDDSSMEEYGILYCNDGTFGNASELIENYKTNPDNNSIKKKMESTGTNIRDYGIGVVAVGYVVVKDKNGNQSVVFSDDIGGRTAYIKEYTPTKTENNGNNYVHVIYSIKVADGWERDSYGILYCNDGAVKDASALIEEYEKNPENSSIKNKKESTGTNLRDYGDGVVAVGYVKVKNSANEEAIVYTGNIGGKYSELTN